MSLETSQELRTVVHGQIAGRTFVNSLPEILDKCRSIEPSTTVYIFKTVKDESGNIVSSNKLDYEILNNCFVAKTIC